MADFTPAQARAIHNLASNIAVSAGAGAGKTRVLVERYINILRQRQANCDEILAITFTNKAAKEMKERIRAKASELAAAATTTEERQLWREVKGQLEYAAIGTFHSFCGRILRENPVEAALDPNFDVLDEMEDALLMEKALKETLEAGLAEEADWLDRLLCAYDKTLLDVIVPDIYEKLASRGLLVDGLAERLAMPYRQALEKVPGIKSELQALCRDLIAQKSELNPKTLQFSRVERLEREWGAVAEAIEAAGGDAKVPHEILADYLDCLDRRSKGKEIVAVIKERLKDLGQARADRAALRLVPDLCQLLLAVKALLDKYKAEHRALTFTDLEVLSEELLRKYPDVRRKYNSRIRQIMVDEFQDTNELQRQIVYLLAGGDAEVLRGDKLFIVGDAKQSIYRFRGADVSVFDRVRCDIVAGGGEAVELDANFRSMDGLLSLYNECFTAIMGTKDDSITFQPLTAYRYGAEAGQVRAEFLAIAKSELVEETAREAEAAAVAWRIKAMVAGEELLLDHDTTVRPVNYGDIAVLFRTAKSVDAYAAALQAAGVPYYIVGGRGFYSCQEVLDVVNLLKVVENRYQEAALAGVLRSPLFLLSDETLARLKAERFGGSLWQGIENAAAAGLPEEQYLAVERARQVLAKLRGLRGNTKIAELIRLALSDTGYMNFVLTQFMGQQKYANLVKLIALAGGFEDKGLFTLGDFLRYVAKLIDGEVNEGEAQIESEGGNTVKLMTIHKSKGLEYPVVFVPDLHRKFNNDTAPILFSPVDGLGLKVPDGGGLAPTSLYEKVASAEKKLSLQELKRLLYVALTRAKDYLVLSGVGDKVTVDKDFGELNSWLGWLGRVYGFAEFAALPDRLAVDKAELLVRCSFAETIYRSCQERAAAGFTARLEQTALARLIQSIGPVAITDAHKPQAFSATKIGEFRHCPRSFYYGYIAGLPENHANGPVMPNSGPPQALTGTVLHRCLEQLEPGLAWEKVLAEVINDIVPFRWQKVVSADAAELLPRYLASDFYQEVVALPTRKEWQFDYFLPDNGGSTGGYHFTGSIDCLVDYGTAGYGIVDYKVSKTNAAQAADKAQEYSLQLLLYAMAVETILGKPVRDAKLYFWRPNVAVSVLVDESSQQAAASEMLAVCRYASEHENESDYACKFDWCSRCGYRFFCLRSGQAGT